MRKTIILLAACLSGCSLVQWLPSSSCEYVKYERTKDVAHVEALCRV